MRTRPCVRPLRFSLQRSPRTGSKKFPLGLESGKVSRTQLQLNGPLTARRYRDEILRAIEVPYAAAIGDDSLLMDDNCRRHCANLVEDLFRGRNRTNGMASVFSRHESNRASLGRSRKTSCWPPTTPTNSKNWKELFWKSGTEYPNS
ncbi:hypothetical protein TNCV_2558931 [Trichonephila clavipes]|nr:hypothetical protein TNCV_2558931 [Trichonephila clavipes]